MTNKEEKTLYDRIWERLEPVLSGTVVAWAIVCAGLLMAGVLTILIKMVLKAWGWSP